MDPARHRGRPGARRRSAAASPRGVAASGIVADAYALDYEDVGDGRVLMSGAMRVRRPDHWLTTVQRWWIYVIRDGRIRRAQACTTREDAIASAAG